jgi:hypothetical protein
MEPDRIAENCPAATELPGLRAPCPCAEFAAKFGTPPPRESCPARETVAEARRRHARDGEAARSATHRALHDLARAVRDAESRAEGLEALHRRRRARASRTTDDRRDDEAEDER